MAMQEVEKEDKERKVVQASHVNKEKAKRVRRALRL